MKARASSFAALALAAFAELSGCSFSTEARPSDMVAYPQCRRRVDEVGNRLARLETNLHTANGLMEAATEIQNVRAEVDYLRGKCNAVEEQRRRLVRYRDKLDELEENSLWGGGN
jgi:chromosome segregation ATPase